MDQQEKIAFASERKRTEFVWTHSIRDYQRFKAEKAWYHCRDIGMPFNTFLTFSFDQTRDPLNDVEMSRKLARWTRVVTKRVGVPTYQLYTRHMRVGSRIENVALLTHIPTEAYEHFKSLAECWDFGNEMTPIKVEQVDYSQSMRVGEKLVTVFDFMFRNMDMMSRREQPDALYEPSEPLFKNVVFESKKIEGERRFI